MSDSQSIGGCTGALCSLPLVTDPVLSPAVDSASIDPIRVMFEHMLAGMARLESRMDDYVRRLPARHTLRPDPEPPDDHVRSRPLEVSLPFNQQLSAVSVVTQQQSTTAAWSGRPEGFRPNPSLATGAGRPGPAQQQVPWDPLPSSRSLPASWDMPPTSRDRGSTWDLPMSTRSSQVQAWGPPPASTGSAAWDPWGNRFPDPQTHSGPASWDQLGQRQPAPPQPPTYDHPLPPGWPPHIHFPNLEYSLNSYVCGNEREVSKQQKREDSYSTSWVTQMEYSYDNARDFGFSECRVAEEDRCDERERIHPTNSIFETKAKEALVHDVATSDTEDVTIPTSDLPAIQEEDVHVSKNVVEARDEAEPVIENPTIIEEAPKKSYAPIAMHLKVTTTTLSRFPASVFVPFLEGKKVFVSFIDMSSTAGIEPHSVNVYGNIEGSRSIIRWAFDPGGVISPKLLFRTLFVVSRFPP